MLLPATLRFLQDHKSWIQHASKSDWTDFYLNAGHDLYSDQVGEVTNTLLSVGINPASFLDYIPSCYLFGSSTLESYSCPSNCSEIGAYAFKGCTNLTSVTFPAIQQQLDQRCFEGCTKLVEVNIPRVWLVGTGVFKDCSSLKSVSLGLGGGSFNIMDEAFAGCDSLSTLFLGEGLLAFAASAFKGCSNLKHIFFEGTAQTWECICKGSSWVFDDSVQIHCKG